MGFEQLGKALAEGMSQEKMEKPMFEDSNRGLEYGIASDRWF